LGLFGEKLRQQREQRGVSLDAISSATKISTRMLRALEEEQFDQLPGGVFNKGFVRAYARQIGMDEDEAVNNYLTALRESQMQQQVLPDFRAPNAGHDNGRAAAEPGPEERTKEIPIEERRKEDRRSDERRNEERRAADDRRKADSPVHNSADGGALPAAVEAVPENAPARFESAPLNERPAQVPWALLAVAGVLLAAGLAGWSFHRHHASVAASTSAATSQPTASAQSSLVQPSSAQAVAATTGAAPESTERAQSASEPKADDSSGTESSASAKAHTMPPAKPTPDTSTLAKTTAPPVPSSHSTDHLTNAPKKVHNAPRPPRSFTLQIRAAKTSWVSVSADGKPLGRETLIAPAQTSVRATHDIVVKAGNAAGISFVLNGKEISAQGGAGEATYVFDATSVHALPQTSNR
jgi:cytoskeletal protein RodZ